jgi:hypothetical protein
VQFVELRRFMSTAGGATTWDRVALARAVLAEIPAQVPDIKYCLQTKYHMQPKLGKVTSFING